MRDAFSRAHPVVNFAYFFFVISFTMFLMHPALLIISFVGAAWYLRSIKGEGGLAKSLVVALPLLLFAALLNPLFNHAGVTIVGYLPSGNPLTLESIVYGLASGLMLAAALLWFSCMNQVLTADKFVYLFGRAVPALSLVMAMGLRFVPLFRQQMSKVFQSQKQIGKDPQAGNIFQRMRSGLNILSITVSWALENAVDSSDSMTARGYGLKGRTSFSIYTWTKADKLNLDLMLVHVAFILAAAFLGHLSWYYFPFIGGKGLSLLNILAILNYIGLVTTPLRMNREEERAWKRTQLTI